MSPVALIRFSLNALFYSGIWRLTPRSLGGRGVILCLHQVCPSGGTETEFSPNAKLEISPEFLKEIIELVREIGYEIVPLSEAILRAKLPIAAAKPFAVFTLDDGYKDNLLHAKPIFEKLNCPFTVFVTPGFVDGTADLWWRGLEKIILAQNSIFCKIGGKIVSLPTISNAQKRAAWDVLLNGLQNTDEHQQRRVVQDMARRYGVNLTSLTSELIMNWGELSTLGANPLCTIGAHTMNHFALAKLSEQEARFEIEQSKRVISQKLGKPVQFLAYPYGDECDASTRDFALALETAFAASLTTRKGVIFAEHANNLQALPRIMISGRYQQRRFIQTLLSGMPTFLINGFRKLNVK
jgi:peptidoglycan/xylan/chitin deacetylase (PgdA/CDA1 family)